MKTEKKGIGVEAECEFEWEFTVAFAQQRKCDQRPRNKKQYSVSR